MTIKIAIAGLLAVALAAPAVAAAGEPVRPKVRAIVKTPPLSRDARPASKGGAQADLSQASGLGPMPVLAVAVGVAALAVLAVSAAGDPPVSPH